jgi:hypothetical protein
VAVDVLPLLQLAHHGAAAVPTLDQVAEGKVAPNGAGFGSVGEPFVSRFYTASRGYNREQFGWPQSHEISTSPLASSQRWLQYSLSCATVHLQAGCAHFFCSRSAMVIPSYQRSGRAYFPPPGGK